MTKKTPHVAHPRAPGDVIQDLAETLKLVREAASRYPHAHDLAYSVGSGNGVAAGGSRGDIKEARPTEHAALGPGADRAAVERAGRAAQRMVKAAREMHSALVDAMPGSDPYEPAWRPSDKDGIATRAERAASRARQDERIRKGEL